MRKERIEDILEEVKAKAKSLGYETEIDGLEEVTDVGQAYYVGRVEALEALLYEIDANNENGH
jgi:hypothetical protein